MVESADAGGTAHSPKVFTGASTAELQAELERRAEQYEADAPGRLIEGLEASLAKYEAHAAHIKEQLAAAKAEAKKGKD